MVMSRGKTPERICTHNSSKRVKSAKNVPFGGFVKKMIPHKPPNSENFTLQKPFFAETTYKSGQKPHQYLYLNRKQPMGISNLGLKI